MSATQGHVLYPRFGEGINPLELIINMAMKTTKTITGYNLDMVLREFYDSVFEISDLDDDTKPLAIIEQSDKEGLWELGPRARLMREFVIYKVREHFCSWNEFISLPWHETQFMINMLRNEEARMRRASEDDQRKINKGDISDI